MRTVRFIREPGYIYDLFTLFRRHFNAAEGEEAPPCGEFSEFDEDVRLFFLNRDDGACFMLQYYYDPYGRPMSSTSSFLSDIQKSLQDTDAVTEHLLRFYFENLFPEEFAQYRRSPAAVNRFIRNARYPLEIQNRLYDLFLDPVPKIQKLSYELMVKEYELARWYEKQRETLFSAQQDFDSAQLEQLFAASERGKRSLAAADNVSISFCLLEGDHIGCYPHEDHVQFVLGLSYMEGLRALQDATAAPDLAALGSVLSEPNRLEILHLLRRWHQASIREMEKELKLTQQNLYYHITMMLKANILRSQNQGRTILYSVNAPYFEKVAELFRHFARDGER